MFLGLFRVGQQDSCPPGGPPSVHNPILLQNNDSYRQNSAQHIFSFDWACFKIGVFKVKQKKNYTILHNIHPGPFHPYIHKEILRLLDQLSPVGQFGEKAS